MSKRVKVLFVSGSLRGGGAEKQMSYLLESIDKARFEPVLCLFREIGVEHIRHLVKIRDLGVSGRFRFAKLIIRLARLIVAEKPEIVLSFLWWSNVYSFLACKLISPKVNPFIILGLRTDLKRYNKFMLTFTKWIYPKANAIVTNAKGLRGGLERVVGVYPQAIRVIENGIDTESVRRLGNEQLSHEWLNDKKTPVIVSVGSLRTIKGYSHLLEALWLVNANTPCRLLIIGEGREEKNLEELTCTLGIRNEVSFLGFQTNPHKYVAKCDVFVLASLYEGMPNVVLEAMAVCTPVVATRTSYGTEEIIEDSVNGFLVQVGDIEMMARRIIDLLKGFDLRERFAEEGMRTVEEKFTVEKMVSSYEKLFCEIVAARSDTYRG